MKRQTQLVILISVVIAFFIAGGFGWQFYRTETQKQCQIKCKHGNCVSGKCVCAGRYAGAFCDEDLDALIQPPKAEAVINPETKQTLCAASSTKNRFFSKVGTSLKVESVTNGRCVDPDENYEKLQCSLLGLPYVASTSTNTSYCGAPKPDMKYRTTDAWIPCSNYETREWNFADWLQGFYKCEEAKKQANDDCGCKNGGICELGGTCKCLPGFGGNKCEIVIKPCPLNCSGHGKCEYQYGFNGQCLCDNGYTGKACETRLKGEIWNQQTKRAACPLQYSSTKPYFNKVFLGGECVDPTEEEAIAMCELRQPSNLGGFYTGEKCGGLVDRRNAAKQVCLPNFTPNDVKHWDTTMNAIVSQCSNEIA